MTLLDRIALVTSGKRVGAVVATELARHGAHVAISYKTSRREAEAAALDVRALGRRAIALRADLATASECVRLVDAAAAELGGLDVLVNTASVYARKRFADLEEADWDRALAVDLNATWACSLAAARHFRRKGSGRIVNFADWTADSGRPRYFGYLPYYVAKAGVVALTEALALELAADRILVNCIAPGPIVPPERTAAAKILSIAQNTPLGRWGGEIEIAKAVVALVETDFVTGETIRVDGGRHLR